jgi:phosphoacetylglucosamine mutase
MKSESNQNAPKVELTPE